MTHEQIIAELVRIWHSPHLDLSLKAGLAEAIETLKEKNRSDSLVTDSSDACKESESKLDLISRQDAIVAIEEVTWYHQNRNGEMVSGANSTEDQAWYKSQDIYTALEALPSADPVQGEWIRVGHDIYECSLCHQNVMTKDIDCCSYCHLCGARMLGEDGEA